MRKEWVGKVKAGWLKTRRYGAKTYNVSMKIGSKAAKTWEKWQKNPTRKKLATHFDLKKMEEQWFK